jgi:soluble lytic murein transglycosylase-like protein
MQRSLTTRTGTRNRGTALNLPILHPSRPAWRDALRSRAGQVLLALAAMLAAAAPARAQASDTTHEKVSFGRKLYNDLHEEVGLLTSSPLPEFRYSSRFGIPRDLARTIEQSARAEGVDPELAFRLVRVESGFNPRARNHSGAAGLMQLMPSTFRRYRRSARGETSLMDPETNLRVGFRYLRTLLDMFDGDVHLAVTAYNRGEDNVARVVRRGDRPTSSYTRHVLGTSGTNPYKGPGRVPKQTAPPAAESADKRR